MAGFKSHAQRKRLHELAAQGKMDKKVLAKMEQETDLKKLPERLGPPSVASQAQALKDRFSKK